MLGVLRRIQTRLNPVRQRNDVSGCLLTRVEDDEQLRRMEEEYLTSMMDTEQGTLDRMALANDLNFGMTSSEGSNVDLLWGMLMGFLLGAIMLLLVRVCVACWRC